MKLEKSKKGIENDWVWEDLTLGKIMAIHNALAYCKNAGHLFTVGKEILDFLEKKLEEVK